MEACRLALEHTALDKLKSQLILPCLPLELHALVVRFTSDTQTCYGVLSRHFCALHATMHGVRENPSAHSNTHFRASGPPVSQDRCYRRALHSWHDLDFQRWALPQLSVASSCC